ncbi:LysR family transcriptional regulator [Flavobacterium sp.]
MFDFRLKVFDTVAKRLNFTKAANELNITQPAVSKHIKEIEQQLSTKLFDRNGTKIKLTKSGMVLLKYTEELFATYRALEFDINQLNQKHQGTLRIGASTTIAQYVLPAVLAKFRQQFKDIKVVLTIHNTEVIEELLTHKKIDLGLIEGASKSKSFQYTSFITDEIVLAARADHPLAHQNGLSIEAIKQIPLLMREPGSGTLETIAVALKKLALKLSDFPLEMQLGNTESIKSYLLHSDSMAFVSIFAIVQELKHKTLTIIDVQGLSIPRDFYFIQSHGEQSGVVSLWLQYVKRNNSW